MENRETLEEIAESNFFCALDVIEGGQYETEEAIFDSYGDNTVDTAREQGYSPAEAAEAFGLYTAMVEARNGDAEETDDEEDEDKTEGEEMAKVQDVLDGFIANGYEFQWIGWDEYTAYRDGSDYGACIGYDDERGLWTGSVCHSSDGAPEGPELSAETTFGVVAMAIELSEMADKKNG